MKNHLLNVTLAILLALGFSSVARANNAQPFQDHVFQQQPTYVAVNCILHPEDCEPNEPEKQPEEEPQEPQEEPQAPAENPGPASDPGTSTKTPTQPTDTAEIPLGSANNGGCQMAPETLEGMGLTSALPFLLSAAGLGLTRSRKRNS